MAMKQDNSQAKLQKKKSENAVPYQVMAALALLCCALAALRAVKNYYSTVGGFSALYDLTPTVALCGGALALVTLVAAAVWKNRVARAVLPWLTALGAVIAATGVSMRISWVEGFSFLYYFCGAIAVQYIIFKLYRWEFFLVSLTTILAGGLYFSLSSGMSWPPRTIFLLLALALSVVLSSVLALSAGRRNGTVALPGKKSVHILGKRPTPVFILAANGLWVLCTAAVLVLGSLFAYYCVFAAIAVEFVAAVYYTFQLN